MYTTEIPVFKNGIYVKKCSHFNDISVGSVLCVGHPAVDKIKPCKYCISYKEDDKYYLPILKEEISIVSHVTCGHPLQNQKKLL